MSVGGARAVLGIGGEPLERDVLDRERRQATHVLLLVLPHQTTRSAHVGGDSPGTPVVLHGAVAATEGVSGALRYDGVVTNAWSYRGLVVARSDLHTCHTGG